jgi:hypothetical protein
VNDDASGLELHKKTRFGLAKRCSMIQYTMDKIPQTMAGAMEAITRLSL